MSYRKIRDLFAVCLALLAVMFTSCRTKPIQSNELLGRPAPPPFIKEFLIDYRRELDELNNPQKLQKWAIAQIETLEMRGERSKIDPNTIPIRFSKRTAMLAWYGHAESATNRHISIGTGGSGAFGWYGIKVGKPTFRPPDMTLYYLEWIPGCYLYYINSI